MPPAPRPARRAEVGELLGVSGLLCIVAPLQGDLSVDERGSRDEPGNRISTGTSMILLGSRPSRNVRVASRSNCGSSAWMQRKNRLRDARAKPGTLKSGWCGIGRPFRPSMPKTAAKAAARIGQLERDRHERRPAEKRPAADVDRVVDRRREPHHEEGAAAAEQAADQDDQGEPVAVEADRLGQPLDRERRVRVDPPIAPLVGLLRRRRSAPRTTVLGQQAVEPGLGLGLDHGHGRSLTSQNVAPASEPPSAASCRSVSSVSSCCSITSSRISVIEITGRNRMNRNSSVKNSPIVP